MGTLNALQVKKLVNVVGRHGDGDNLYLEVKRAGSGSWTLRIQWDGKRRDLGIGSAKLVSLLEARTKAADYRKLIGQGIDPRAFKKAAQQTAAGIPTFKGAALLAHAALNRSWKNEKHAAQWLATMETYVFPLIGKLPVDQIDAGRIISVLSPIWLRIPETARRVRQRIGVVLDWSLAHGHRQSEAPIRTVTKALPKQPKNDGHFAALPYPDIPPLMLELSSASGVGSMALRFAILTAARSGEVRKATWGEVDIAQKLWTIPGSRMKAGKAHVIPLSAAAVAILSEAKGERSVRPDEAIFPGRTGKFLSDMTLSKALRGVTDQPATVHGFRSSFRDWVAEKEIASNDVAEAALAHTPPTKVIAAYRRTNYLELRRDLMEKWAAFIVPTSRTVPIEVTQPS